MDRLSDDLRRNPWQDYIAFFETTTSTLPNPPATRDEVTAAEKRLGPRLPPQYAELLYAVNGWERYDGVTTILGTADLGIDSFGWKLATQSLQECLTIPGADLPMNHRGVLPCDCGSGFE